MEESSVALREICPSPQRSAGFAGSASRALLPLRAADGCGRWLFLAARALGLDNERARLCEQSHVFPIGRCQVAVCPLGDDTTRWWYATAIVPRQSAIGHSAWLDALLRANATVMPRACMAFALDDSERAVLMMRMANTGDSAALAAELRLFVAVWSAAAECTSRDPQTCLVTCLAEDGAASAAWQAQAVARRFEADASSLDVEQFLRRTLLAMGATVEQSDRAAECRQFCVNDIELIVDPAPDDASLLLTTELSDEPAHRMTTRAALQATAALMPGMGAAVGRDAVGFRVLANWSTNSRDSEDLARYLLAFAMLPQALEDRVGARTH